MVIEHNLDVIKMADHIIEIGPDGGSNGGKIINTGTPEEIILSEKWLYSLIFERRIKLLKNIIYEKNRKSIRKQKLE